MGHYLAASRVRFGGLGHQWILFLEGVRRCHVVLVVGSNERYLVFRLGQAFSNLVCHGRPLMVLVDTRRGKGNFDRVSADIHSHERVNREKRSH